MTKRTSKEILILVDKKDKELGFSNKDKCHSGKGLKHRAFIVFFVNKKGEILLAKRSKQKKLWPRFWDVAVASHVLKGESYKQAAVRRIFEEQGLKVSSKDLKDVGGFSYRSEYENLGSEDEYCRILTLLLTKPVKFNPEEIEAIRFLNRKFITKELSTAGEKFTPWFKIAYRMYLGLSK